MRDYFSKKVTCRLSAGLLLVICGIALAGCNNQSPADKPLKYIELGQYKELDIQQQVHEVTEEELNEEIEFLASAYATEDLITEGKVEEGDIANIDYVGKLNGVAFDGGTASGYDLGIGTHTFIEGFEEGLIGAEVGKTVDLPLTFPENYGNADLAGQEVIFTVTVNSVNRKILPDVTDDFINDISKGQYNDLNAYKDALKEQIASEYEEQSKLQYYSDLLKLAVDNATVVTDIPTEYINEKVTKIVLSSQDYAKAYGISYDEFLTNYMGMNRDEFNQQSAEYAVEAAKQTLVVLAIAEAENITISDEELSKAIDEYVVLGQYENAEDFKNKNDMNDFNEYILTSKVQDFLAENAKK